MKQKALSVSRYFAVLSEIKLPYLLILCNLITSLAMMNAEIQVATLTAGIIDTSQNAINAKELAGYVAITALSAALSILANYFSRKMEEVITFRLRVKLWEKIMRLPTAYYDEDSGDGLVSRITSDAAEPASLITTAISCIVCIVTTVQAFLQLFSYHKLLATYSLLIIPLTLMVCLIYGNLLFRLGVYSTATAAGSLGYLAERVRNFRLIKSAVAERQESEKGNLGFRKLYKTDFLNWLVVAGYQAASGLFSILFLVIVFVIGGQLIRTGEVTIGDLTSFYMITGIVSLQLMQFFMNISAISGSFGSMKKIAQILTVPAEPEGGIDVPALCADLVFDRVSFSYAGGPEVIHDLSVRIPMGKVTAVIGGNGAGKSTLFKLIARLYEPKSGEIRFGSDPIASYNLTAWRNRFSYVFQKNLLIGGTVRENITYGLNREVSEEELIAVTKRANCYDCIREKPGGFDEDVGLGGSNFSGGQGQCIAIARALLRGTDYLLLDEATSNLDAVSETMVTEAMDHLMQNKTTVMIAHNYAAARHADYIIVMKDGTVEAAGTPQELQETNDFYRLFRKTL